MHAVFFLFTVGAFFACFVTGAVVWIRAIFGFFRGLLGLGGRLD